MLGYFIKWQTTEGNAMKLLIIFTTEQATVNDIRGMLGPELSGKAFRADSLGENGFCVGIFVPDSRAREVVSKLTKGGIKSACVFSGIKAS
jgi:hypothetical protein